MTLATVGYGSKLEYGDGAVPEVFTRIAEVVTFSGPSDTITTIDATNMDSPNSSREFIYGLIDRGQITFEANFLPQNPGQRQMRTDASNKITRNYKITFSDAAGTNVTFPAIVEKIERSAQIDAPLRLNVTLKVTGNPVWLPA